jgi:hypothetical protein
MVMVDGVNDAAPLEDQSAKGLVVDAPLDVRTRLV